MQNTPYRVLTAFSAVIFTLAVPAFAQNSIAIEGLSSKVTVRRDGRSIPYIEAENDADLYFAQGYETARDRLWQMDLLRRVARGETAEIFGKQALEADKRWRRFGFAQVAEDTLNFLRPDLRNALDAYARGVNAYIRALDEASVPIEFKILQYRPSPWRPSDTVIIGKILADGLSNTWRQDLLQAALTNFDKEKLADLNNLVTAYDVVLFGRDAAPLRTNTLSAPATPQAVLAAAARDDEVRTVSLEQIGLYVEDLAASNNWVISGKLTADGKPLLANDPHLPPNVPGIWYLTHLSTPSMRVSGVTFPGVPGVVLGHNEFIAWGATNIGPDVQDLYLETFDSLGNAKTPEGFRPVVLRREIIKVRSNVLKPETENVELNVRTTRHGPIILEEAGKAYALRWTAFDPKNKEFEAFFMANRARNWQDFKAALRGFGGAAQNFVYADVKGNIGWYAAGRIPLRKTGHGSLPYDGATDDGAWIGYIPFEELPNLYNPKEGLIVTANQRTTGTTYKHHRLLSRDAAPPWRARRILDALTAKTRITMDDVRDVQHDVYNILLANLSKQIVKLNAASPETLNTLRAWDGRMAADSKGALVTNEIRVCLSRTIASENKPVPEVVIRERVLHRAVEEQAARWLPKLFASYTDLFRSCDTSVRSALADPKRFGPDESKWKWGGVMRSTFSHPLAAAPLIGMQFAIPPVPLDGSGQTPNVASSVSMRHISSPGNWDATRFVIPLGQSGDPRSPFYKDQFDAWRTGSPLIFPFSKAAVAAAAKETTLLTPGR